MQESAVVKSDNMQRLVGIFVPVFLFIFVATRSPFAILRRIALPPDPTPPGWYSSLAIFLWGEIGARPTLLIASPFVIMTIIYVGIQVAVSMREFPAKYGVLSGIVLLVIWVTVCQMIYGTLQDWTLVQVPILPLVGIFFLLAIYWYQLRY